MSSVAIFYANQCDKKKCTSIKIKNNLEKLNFHLFWTENSKNIRKNSIVLTPNSKKYLLPKDLGLFDKAGITLLDCSWKQGEEYLSWIFKNARRLPPLLAGNPVNYGKWEKLTSLEALAASFFLLRQENYCFELLNLYNWGNTFFTLNKKLLDRYIDCTSNLEINRVYNEFLKQK